MAQQSKTFQCDDGHIVTVGDWVKTAPACVLCKITEKTRKLAGFEPRFESRRWEISALTFNAYCPRGHLYEASLSNTKPCEICSRAQHIEEDSGFAPHFVANYAKYTKFRCRAGHLFMANDLTTGCPGCKCAETIKAADKKVHIVSIGTIFWGRNTYAKFACEKCENTFYSNQDEIKSAGPHILACPHSTSAVSRTIKLLEKYYSASFDESQMIGDGVMLRVCGYNSRIHTAVVHTDGFPVDPATEKWCRENGVRLLKVSAAAGIEKTLARQISELDGADYDAVLERMCL